MAGPAAEATACCPAMPTSNKRSGKAELRGGFVEAHLTPAQHDHINFYGTYSLDVETELRREGHRPLRSPAA
jgi:hypothetical protein